VARMVVGAAAATDLKSTEMAPDPEGLAASFAEGSGLQSRLALAPGPDSEARPRHPHRARRRSARAADGRLVQ
jgi:hypothetical protein